MNRILKNLMAQIEVECPNCKKTMDFKTLGSEGHVASCISGPSVCPLDCGKEIKSTSEGIAHWELHCPQTMCVCIYCKKGI